MVISTSLPLKKKWKFDKVLLDIRYHDLSFTKVHHQLFMIANIGEGILKRGSKAFQKSTKEQKTLE